MPFDRSKSSIFFIPEECQSRYRVTGVEEDKGKPCDHYSKDSPYCYHVNEDGKQINHTLSKWGRYTKKRVTKYRDYKDALRDLGEKKKFEFPEIGLGIMFYMPMPKRWTKTKKRHMHLQWHQSTPDLSNCLKAVEDAFKKQDMGIAFYQHLGQKWVNFEQGWIEFTMPTKEILEKHERHRFNFEILIPKDYEQQEIKKAIS